MEKPRVLSGEALVAKGITKIDASLPEVGLKDVMPNGSWLEQKQIQASLEARKCMIEVERIEKCGTLSHAEWRDDLMLAEVTQKAGSYWQYLGHNVGKTLYLRPEEALFLLEVNCLLLKHNEVTVSLQKAHSLLLSSSTTMIQYNVYASLSRLGYRVFRHTGPKVNDEKKGYNQNVNKVELNVDPPTISIDDESKDVGSPTAPTNKSGCVNSPIVTTVNESENIDSPIVSKEKESENVDLTIDSTLSSSDNVDLTIDSTLSNSDNGGSAIETVVMNVDSSVVPLEPEKAESDELIDITVSSDTKSDNSTIADTVPDSEMVETPKDEDTVKKSENHESPIDAQTNKLSEHLQEQVNDLKVKETNGNIVEMVNIRDSEPIADTLDVENSVAKENESPNIMEVDDTEFKTADNKMEIETIQEVSSKMIGINKNVENKMDSMEICTENQEATGNVSSSILIIEESGDKSNNVEATPAEEPNSMISSCVPIDIVELVNTNEGAVSVTTSEVGRKDTGTQTIEDSTKSLENVPNNNNPSNSKISTSTENSTQKACCSKDNDSYDYSNKIEKLTKRQFKPSDSEAMQRYFENIPDFSKERVVTINVPEQQFIPKNIFVNKASYTLNLQNITMRSVRSVSSESPDYTSSDEVNGTNIRRIRSSSEVLGIEYPQNPNFFPQVRFPRYHHFRPYGFWRPQNNHNFYQLMFFQTRIQYHQRPPPFLRPACFTMNPNNLNVNNNSRKRLRSGKLAHFQGIKNLAVRLKQSLISGNTDMRNLESLHGLLHSYNLRYKTRLRLNEHFDVINEEKIVETIDLDDDEESKSKKPRLEHDDDDKFDENLYRLRQLALRLRDLETKDKATASHRRALSKAIKTFNTSYDADIYLDDDNYQVIDRRCITLDSSSESDCVVEEQPQARPKKLRNPFNVLKRRRERSLNNPGTSKDDNSSDTIKLDPGRAETDEDNNKYSELAPKIFNEYWLPKENDFGRAEIVPKPLMNSRLEFSSKEQFLYEYMKDQFQQYQNWVEAKVSFLRYLEKTNNAFKRENARILADAELCNNGLKPLIDFEDSSDMPSVLEKLRIIENNKEIDTETSLRVDFDVYNRNVQNFRKKSPPKPHFRIICMDESSGVPSAAHVMSLHSKYKDNVPIVFAIVTTASISYLQINPIDLPIYVPSNDVV